MIKEAMLFWCIAVPVVENGDDYYSVSSKIINACSRAMERCESHYHDCEVKYCGSGDVPSFTECDMRYFVDDMG